MFCMLRMHPIDFYLELKVKLSIEAFLVVFVLQLQKQATELFSNIIVEFRQKERAATFSRQQCKYIFSSCYQTEVVDTLAVEQPLPSPPPASPGTTTPSRYLLDTWHCHKSLARGR